MLSRDGTPYLCGSCRFYQPVATPLGHGMCVCHPKQVIAYAQRDPEGKAALMTQMVRPIVKADDPLDACGQWEPNVRRAAVEVLSRPPTGSN